MKQLNSNFTTPEQSKRLLELGLPADSADCYYEAFGFGKGYQTFPNACGYFDKDNLLDLPCWSVGRLIEILKLCVTSTLDFIDIIENVRVFEDTLQILVQAFSEYADVIDFSKLEE